MVLTVSAMQSTSSPHIYKPRPYTTPTFQLHISYPRYIPPQHSTATFHLYIPSIHSTSTFHLNIPSPHSTSTFHLNIPPQHSISTFHAHIPSLHSSPPPHLTLHLHLPPPHEVECDIAHNATLSCIVCVLWRTPRPRVLTFARLWRDCAFEQNGSCYS